MSNIEVYKPTEGVALRREMINMPDVMNTLNPADKALFEATTLKTIREQEPADLTNALRNSLKWIAKDVGYRMTDQFEIDYLLIRTAEILKRYYSYISLKEFQLAFELATAGVLDEFLPKNKDGQADREHYQMFNVDYICKILNAYVQHRGQVIQKAKKALPQPEKKIDEAEQKRYRNATRKDIIELFEDYKMKRELPNITYLAIALYNLYLEDVGILVKLSDDKRERLRQTFEVIIDRKEELSDYIKIEK